MARPAAGRARRAYARAPACIKQMESPGHALWTVADVGRCVEYVGSGIRGGKAGQVDPGTRGVVQAVSLGGACKIRFEGFHTATAGTPAQPLAEDKQGGKWTSQLPVYCPNCHVVKLGQKFCGPCGGVTMQQVEDRAELAAFSCEVGKWSDGSLVETTAETTIKPPPMPPRPPGPPSNPPRTPIESKAKSECDQTSVVAGDDGSSDMWRLTAEVYTQNPSTKKLRREPKVAQGKLIASVVLELPAGALYSQLKTRAVEAFTLDGDAGAVVPEFGRVGAGSTGDFNPAAQKCAH